MSRALDVVTLAGDAHKHPPALPVRLDRRHVNPPVQSVRNRLFVFEMTETTRGGPGRGQGRKPLSRDEPTVPVVIRITTSQRNTLLALGGAKWVRNQIEKAGIESGNFVRPN